MNEQPTILDLFTGIGGFSLAFAAEGFRVMAHAETDPDAALVLSGEWPHVPNLGDVTKLCRRAYDCEQLPDDDDYCFCPRCQEQFGECACIGTDAFTDTYGFPDVITGGVPCQPASHIGQRRGTADERWLWPDTLRIVGELGPRFCLFENPPAILTLESGRAWNGIVSSLSALGYDCWWDIVPGAAVGAGHLRERVFLLATDHHCPRLEGHPRHGHGNQGPQPAGYAAAPLVRGLERPDWLQTQSPVVPLVHGLPGGLVEAAVRCVGNAVVPQIVQVYARAIKEMM